MLEGRRREITERAVAPRRIIERFDIVEGGKFGFAACGRNDLLEAGLRLEGTEPRFREGVVVAVARAAHAALDVVLCQRREIILVNILAAAIGVVQQPGRGLALTDRAQ